MADIDVRADIKAIALKYAMVLKQEFQLHSLYLYGSYAKCNYRQDSDIDLAVVADDFSGDIVDDTFKLMKIRRLVDYRIEPHPFLTRDFSVDNPMAREVLQTGIRVI